MHNHFQLLSGALTVIIAVSASGCSCHYSGRWGTRSDAPPFIVAPSAAPAAKQEAVTPKPRGSHTWIAGHWIIINGEWIWQPGRWVKSRPGYQWTAPVVVRVNGAHRYYPGYWRRSELQKPRPYQKGPRVSRARSASKIQPPTGTSERQPPGSSQSRVRAKVGGTTGGTGRPKPETSKPETSEPETLKPETSSSKSASRPPSQAKKASKKVASSSQTSTDKTSPAKTDASSKQKKSSGEKDSASGNSSAPPTSSGSKSSGGLVLANPSNKRDIACKLNKKQTKRGGVLTIRGTGFTGNARIEVAGSELRPIMQAKGVVQVRPTRSGKVTLEERGITKVCGTIEVAD